MATPPLGTGLAPIAPKEPQPPWQLVQTHKQPSDAAWGMALLVLEFPKHVPALILTLNLPECAATVFSWKIKHRETHYATGKGPSPAAPPAPLAEAATSKSLEKIYHMCRTQNKIIALNVKIPNSACTSQCCSPLQSQTQFPYSWVCARATYGEKAKPGGLGRQAPLRAFVPK